MHEACAMLERIRRIDALRRERSGSPASPDRVRGAVSRTRKAMIAM
jgi:hypothetical protein